MGNPISCEKITVEAGDAQEQFDSLAPAAATEAMRVRVCGLYRFAETLKACEEMSDRCRFSVHDGDIQWSLYPNTRDPARYKISTGAPVVQTLRGAFWHTDSDFTRPRDMCLYADAVVPCSNSIANAMLSLWPQMEGKVTVVKQGSAFPSMDEIKPWTYTGVKRPIYITVSDHSFMMKSAGVVELCSLFWGGKNGTLVVAGSGKFDKQVVQGPNVIDIGHTDDAYGAMAGADAFLYNSMQDGVPMALREAMAIGLPCAVRRHPWSGASEIVEHGNNGLTFDSLYELEKMLDILPSSDVGSNARAWLENNLTWRHYADQMCEIFEDVLNHT